MKEYKRVWNVYAAWDYTREIEDLNKMSDNGWQLICTNQFLQTLQMQLTGEM